MFILIDIRLLRVTNIYCGFGINQLQSNEHDKIKTNVARRIDC